MVGLDANNARILAIGGNVRGAVSLKLLPASFDDTRPARVRSVGFGRRAVFAHLKLRAAAADPDALVNSPALRVAREHGVTLEALLPEREARSLDPASAGALDPS